MVRFCSLFDAKERAVTFLNGQTYSLASLRALGMGSLLDAMFDFSEKLGSMGLEPDEMALFMAVVLVSAGNLTFLHICHLVPFPVRLTFISCVSLQIARASWMWVLWSSCRKT